MKEQNEDVLDEARRYLADLVAFEGTQFTAPELVAEHSAEESMVDTLEAFRRQICECTRCRLGATRQAVRVWQRRSSGWHYVHRRGSGGPRKTAPASPLWGKLVSC